MEEEGLRPSEKYIEAIRNLVGPASGDEIMRLLGLLDFFSAFIDHFADKATPFYEVLRGTGFSKNKRHYPRNAG